MNSVFGHMPSPVRAPRVEPLNVATPSVSRHPWVEPWVRNVTLMLADILGVVIAIVLVNLVAWSLGETGVDVRQGAVLVGLMVLTFGKAGLYQAFPRWPVEELRAIARSTIYVVIVLGGAVVFLDGSFTLEHVLLGLGGFLMTILVPMARALIRRVFGSYDWWRSPVVVLGAGPAGASVVHSLIHEPRFGLRPVAVVDEAGGRPAVLHGVRVVKGLKQALRMAVLHQVRYAIVAMPELPRADMVTIMEHYTRYFSRILVVPDLSGFASLWVRARDFNGKLGFEVHHQLLAKWQRRVKLATDLVVASGMMIFAIPMGLVIALLIKLDSPGPVFYTQQRLGREGRCFKLIKFRSMYRDADRRLAALLRENDAARIEYTQYRKLRNDPRVTPLGQFLRRYSLDELPQLINVFLGDMSVVGPRAYLPEELMAMGLKSRTILRTPPGITGYWQVFARNDVPFETRLEMDVYYVRNWSIWLDLFLLARTPPVVLSGRGAS